MSANAQRDGHPAEYRWRPLLNAAMFGNMFIQVIRFKRQLDYFVAVFVQKKVGSFDICMLFMAAQ